MLDFIYTNMMWIWLAIMIICVVIEVFTFSLTTVWGAISAFILIFLSKTNMEIKWQVLIFLVLTVVLMLVTRPIAVKKLKIGKNKTNVDTMIGEEILVTKEISEFQKGEGKAKNGVIWTCKSADNSTIEKDSVCRILVVEGNTLTIEKINK